MFLDLVDPGPRRLPALPPRTRAAEGDIAPAAGRDPLPLRHEEAPDLHRAICLATYADLRVAEAAALHWRDVDARDV